MEELERRARVEDGDGDAGVEEEALVPHPHDGGEPAVHLQRYDHLTKPLLPATDADRGGVRHRPTLTEVKAVGQCRGAAGVRHSEIRYGLFCTEVVKC